MVCKHVSKRSTDMPLLSSMQLHDATHSLDIVARLSCRVGLCIFSDTLDETKHAAWNGSHPGLGFTRIDTFFCTDMHQK